MTPREHLARLESELSRLTTRVRALSSDLYRATDMARALYTEVTEADAELTRHHRDFQRIRDILDEVDAGDAYERRERDAQAFLLIRQVVG